MKYRSNNILAFIPQNEAANEVLKKALFFQQRLGMRIFILNIIKPASFFTRKIKPKLIDKLKEKNRLELKRFLNKALLKDVPKEIVPKISMGKTLPTLKSESELGGYEFLMIFKDKDVLKGSLTDEEINNIFVRSYCPVLILTKDFPLIEIKKIIVPIDITQKTKKKLMWATFFAKKFNAKIQVVSALDSNLNLAKSLTNKNAEKIKNMLLLRNVKCDIEILRAPKKDRLNVIIEYIKKEKPGMVLFRTHHKTVYSGTRMEKFDSILVHECEMPVFTVGPNVLPLPLDFDKC